MLSVQLTNAHQGRGIFFSVFGNQAPETSGDIDNRQAFYIDIPESETRPVYLILFDANVGGRYEEQQGRNDTQTRFSLLGNTSTANINIKKTGLSQSQPNVNNADIIYSRPFGEDPAADATYISLGRLPMEKGLPTNDGYRRFVLLVEGISGNDGNYFDFVLSHDPDTRDIPETIRMFVYDLPPCIPDWTDFTGNPLPFPLPIRDFELPQTPSIAQDVAFSPQNCSEISFSPTIDNGSFFNFKDINWYFSDETLTGTSITTTFKNHGYYPYTLAVKGFLQGKLIRHTIRDSILINQPPTAWAGSNRTHIPDKPLAFEGTVSEDPNGYIKACYWNFGFYQERGKSVRYAFQEPGRYPVVLNVTDNLGISADTDTLFVTVHAPPVPLIAGDFVYATGRFTLSAAESYDPDGHITAFHWDMGDSTIISGETAEHVFQKPGTYQVQLKVEDDSGLKQATGITTKSIIMNHPPQLIVKYPDRIAPDSTILFDASGSFDPDGNITSFLWNFNGTWQKGDEHITVDATQPNRDIKVAVRDDAGVSNSQVEKSYSFHINESPVAIAGEDKSTDRKTIVFDGSESYDPDDDDIQYYWDFGDGGSGRGAIISHTYRHGGRYKAILTVDDQRLLSNSFDSDTVNVFINRSPDAFFELPYAVCVQDTFRYDGRNSFDIDGNENLRFDWVFGDGTTAQSATGVHQYEQIGTYEVELTVDDTEGMSNSTDTFTQTIQVIGAPVADAGAHKTVYMNEIVQFDGSGSRAAEGMLNQYIWDFGDGATGSGVTPEHSYSETGIYQVSLKIAGNDYGSCAHTDSDEVMVTVLETPQAQFSIPPFLLTGENLTLDATPSVPKGVEIRRFTWEITGLDTITWSHRTYRDSTGRRISEWITNGSNLTSPRMVPDRTTSVQLPKTTLSSLPNGMYEITLTVETSSRAGRYVARNSKFLEVRERENLALPDIPTLVPGQLFNFRLKSTYIRPGNYNVFKWNFGDGTTAEGNNVEHSYENPGTYEVTFIADDGRGSQYSRTELNQKVTVNAPPVATIEAPGRVAPHAEVQFDATSSYDPDGSITDYEWFFSDGTRKSGSTVTHSFNRPGNFAVSLTVKDNEGVANSVHSDNKIIMVAPPPDITLKMPNAVCPDVSLNFVEALSLNPEDSSLVTIQIGENRIPFAEADNHTFKFPGKYRLTVSIDDGSGNNPKIIRQTIIVNGGPEIYAEVPQKAIIGAANEFVEFDASNTFDPNGDVLNYFWDLGDGTQKKGKVVRHQYRSSGAYTVLLTVVDNKGMKCSVAEKEYQIEVVER